MIYVMNKIMDKDCIEIEGIRYNKTDKYIRVDCITGEYINIREQNCTIVYTDIRIDRVKIKNLKFDRNDDNSYNFYSPIKAHTLYINFLQNSNNLVNFNFKSTGKFALNISEIQKQELINKLDLALGKFNINTYFDKNEIEYMDKPLPYRKFDYTYYKKTLTEILNRPVNSKDLGNKEVQEIIKNLIKRNIEMGVSSLTFKEFEGLKYTFGVELETVSGRFEDNEVRHLNVKAVHDGSLRESDGSSPVGGEYVTGVLTGDAGISQLHEICRVLQTKCTVDKRTGVHVHIGNLNWTKEEVVYSYILAELIEDELFSTLPKSRRSNIYCRPINKIVAGLAKELSLVKGVQEYNIKIDEIYDCIFKIVSGLSSSEKASKNINKKQNHPKGSKCGYDKDSQRYCWLNYVTLLFNTKGIDNSWTLEFRPMSGTLNFTKIKNWLKICVAFCSFVENNKSLIKNGYNVPVTLDTIINSVYKKTGTKLINYINERKQLFMSADESVDYAVDSKISKKSMKEVVCAS